MQSTGVVLGAALMLSCAIFAALMSAAWWMAMYTDTEVGDSCREFADEYMSHGAGLTMLLAIVPVIQLGVLGHTVMTLEHAGFGTGTGVVAAAQLSVLIATVVELWRIESAGRRGEWEPPPWADYHFQWMRRRYHGPGRLRPWAP